LKIRRADPADVPALAIIAERSYRAAFRAILEDDVLAARDAAFFAQRFEAVWGRMWVALSDREVVGFCLMTDGHIDMLFVDPDSAGQGAGAGLLRQAEAMGARSLECFRDNHPARRFYEKHGWTIDREYRREFLGRERSFIRLIKEPA
jgi:putative acetyltransferase